MTQAQLYDMDKQYHVYIMSSISGVIYVGITNNLKRRVFEHKEGLIEGFTKKYQVKKLVYFEATNNVEVALNREKEIKKWRREKKLALIKSLNPALRDLYDTI